MIPAPDDSNPSSAYVSFTFTTVWFSHFCGFFGVFRTALGPGIDINITWFPSRRNLSAFSIHITRLGVGVVVTE